MNGFDLPQVMSMSRLRTFGDVPVSTYADQERDPSTGYDGNRSMMGLGDLDNLNATIKSSIMMGRMTGMSSCGQPQHTKTKLSAEYKLMWVFAFIIAAFVLVSWKHHTSSTHHGE